MVQFVAPGLDELGRFVNRRELEALQPIVAKDEEVRYALEATRGARQGLLAATDRRILFVVKTLLRRRVESWEYDDVAATRLEKSVQEATLTLVTRGGEVAFAHLRKAAAEGFAEAARTMLGQREFRLALVVNDPRQATEIDGDSVQARLLRLERMRIRRSITEPEYKVNRRRILEDAGMPTDLRRRPKVL